MGIGDWFKRLRARDDAAIVQEFEKRRELKAELPEGERFLADEDGLSRGLDQELLHGDVWGSGPRDSDK